MKSEKQANHLQQKKEFKQTWQNDKRRLQEIAQDSQEILNRYQQKKSFLNLNAETSGLMSYAHLGIEFAFIFGIIFYVGYYADKKFGYSPLFLILGSLLGFAVAMVRILRAAQEMLNSSSTTEKKKNERL